MQEKQGIQQELLTTSETQVPVAAVVHPVVSG